MMFYCTSIWVNLSGFLSSIGNSGVMLGDTHSIFYVLDGNPGNGFIPKEGINASIDKEFHQFDA